jgi:hypothetical protein
VMHRLLICARVRFKHPWIAQVYMQCATAHNSLEMNACLSLRHVGKGHLRKVYRPLYVWGQLSGA